MYFSVHLCIFLWISVNFCNFVYFSVHYCEFCSILRQNYGKVQKSTEIYRNIQSCIELYKECTEMYNSKIRVLIIFCVDIIIIHQLATHNSLAHARSVVFWRWSYCIYMNIKEVYFTDTNCRIGIFN